MLNLKNFKKIPSLFGRDGIFLFIAIIIFIGIFGFIALNKYYTFGYNGLDLAIINQSFYLTLNGDFLGSTIHPPSYWADHFSPIILLLIPFYAIWPEPPLLLLLQISIIALCAIPIYLISKKVFKNNNWSLIISITWLINPFVQNITLFEFHLLGFGAFGVLWLFYFYQNQKWWPFIITGILTLLIREDLSLVVASFGLLALIEKKSWKWFLVPIFFSAVYFLFSLNLINQVSLDNGYKFLQYYSWLGSSFNQIIFNALTKPWLVVNKIVSPGSFILFTALLSPLAFTPLLRLRYLILSLLIFLQLASGTSWQFLGIVLVTQYSSLLLPGFFIASIYGIQKITERKKYRFILLGRPHLLTFILATSIISGFLFGPLLNVLTNSKQSSLDISEKKELLTKIPKTASVAGSYDSLAMLSSRNQLASINYAFLQKLQFGYSDFQLPIDTEYILLNTQDYLSYIIQYKNNSLYKNFYQNSVNTWPEIFKNYGLIKTSDNWALLKKDYQSTKKLLVQTNEYPLLDYEQKKSMLTFNFLGITQKEGRQLELWWEKSNPLDTEIALFINFIKDKQIIFSRNLPIGYGLITNDDGRFFGMLYNPPVSIADQYDSIELQLAKIKKGNLEISGNRGLKTTFEYSSTSDKLFLPLRR